MCKIRPFVDLHARTLTVSAPAMPDLVLPLHWETPDVGGDTTRDDSVGTGRRGSWGRGPAPPRSRNGAGGSGAGGDGGGDGGGGGGFSSGGDSSSTIVRVCGNRRAGVTCSASVSAWFTRFLGVPCSLVRAATVTFDPPTGGGGSGGVTPSALGSPSSDNTNGSAVASPELATPAPAPALAPARAAAAAAVAAAVAAGGVANRAFANEAQYLLISRASVGIVNKMICESSLTGGHAAAGTGTEDGFRRSAPKQVRTYAIAASRLKILKGQDGRAGGRLGSPSANRLGALQAEALRSVGGAGSGGKALLTFTRHYGRCYRGKIARTQTIAPS